MDIRYTKSQAGRTEYHLGMRSSADSYGPLNLVIINLSSYKQFVLLAERSKRNRKYVSQQRECEMLQSKMFEPLGSCHLRNCLAPVVINNSLAESVCSKTDKLEYYE